MIGVQREITERAIELLKLPEGKPCFILDIGCGSGLSGRALEEHGHAWVGCDISRDMLDVANERIQAGRGEKNSSASSTGGNDDKEDNEMMEEDDDDSDEEQGRNGKRLQSVGDLMHHVSLWCFIRMIFNYVVSYQIFE